MNNQYFRFPTIAGDTVVFVSEDDLWSVSASGGTARRLTDNLGLCARPVLSRDGKWLAWTGTEEGHGEVYVMPASGGTARRLTWLGCDVLTLRFTADNRGIEFASNVGQPFLKPMRLYTVDRDGGPVQQIPVGPAEAIARGPRNACVIGRAMGDPARWKRYKGGTAGDLWIDRKGDGEFQRLIELKGNLASPMWVGDRIWFLSDHEGIGNLYSCLPDGTGLRRETKHDDFYARFPQTDGRKIVYQCGADLWILDPKTRRSKKLAIDCGSPRAQLQRKFVPAEAHLEHATVHPASHSVMVTARGKSFAMGFWEGPVRRIGELDQARYRFTRWLRDGESCLTVTDAHGDEAIEIHRPGKSPQLVTKGQDLGRILDLALSPAGDEVAFTNHRFELFHLDVVKGKLRRLDQSRFERIGGFSWSADGRWIAYGYPTSESTSQIRIVEVKSGKVQEATRADFRDYSPSFDPEGKYLYFLSYRVLDPVYDALYFDLGFPRGTRPYLLTLRTEVTSPFVPRPKPFVEQQRRAGDQAKPTGDAKAAKEEKDPRKFEIDFDGLPGRIVAFPVPEGKYDQIVALRGKVLYTNFPIEGSLGINWSSSGEPPAKGTLELWDFTKNQSETWMSGITDVTVAPDLRTLLVRAGNRLRVVNTEDKPKENATGATRESGWLDLSRIRLAVVPAAEWEQMFRETWRLQRDHFWRADMSGVNWDKVYKQYRPLLDRVGARSELSDLIWEVQGELGTSHCYEMGGDYRGWPQYRQGFLGADLECGKDGKWRITRVVRGDSWDPDRDSPLARPGVNAKVGEAIVAVDGTAVGDRSPSALLVHRAGQEVALDLEDAKGKRRTVVVRALKEEFSLRYRAWVEGNREWVHAHSKGQVGYVHVPNMGPLGYSEFHRYYLAEVSCPALLIDVRNNGGGHVSQLLLEKLARRRLGYDLQRWGQPLSYPMHAPAGPILALTNEYAGSDGDIFSHCFKLMKLGPLMGKRTWGGVVGIWPRHPLVDGTVTTQPEFSFWFNDVGYGVENYGTDPDIEVENRPQDVVAGRDPQLERAAAELLRMLKENPVALPEFDGKKKRK